MAARLLHKLFFIFSIILPNVAFASGYTTSAGPKPLFAAEISTASKILDLFIEFCVKYSFQALGGVIVIIAGVVISKIVARIVGRILARKHVDVTVSKFMLSALRMVIVALAVLIALGSFGITIAPFIAGISVIGFGTSFALQGPLSNYAAGVTLIFTKPFKVGDIVEVSAGAGVIGEVVDMTLARTELKTIDGTIIFVPNKSIIGEIIHNYSEYKKLDLTVGISYNSDVQKAIDIINGFVRSETRISQDPVPKIGVSEFGESSIKLYGRLWCRQSDYWDVLFSLNKKIHDEFRKNGVVIPFPQREVRVIKD